uniref:Lysosomal alpha-glucosidase n=1 Tax=Cacopsylla melanoneura TaxID=428564 RepID=A0A8D8R499_9HEMI
MFRLQQVTFLLLCFHLLNISLVEGEGAVPRQADAPQCSNEKFNDLKNRFDCFPRGVATQESCQSRGCCWRPLQPNSLEPWCFYPANYRSYQIDQIQELRSNGLSLVYKNVLKSPYPDDIEFVRVDVEYETDTRLRVKIYDDKKSRYEPPYPKLSKSKETSPDPKYKIEFGHLQDSNFGFAVVRKATNRVLFDTRNAGGFTMADQFLQISARLASSYVYGLGEIRKPFRNEFNWTTFGILSHDQPPTPYDNVYGSHPFFLSMEDDGKSHGVFLHNSNAWEAVMQPTSAITYRVIGGVLDFYFFLGDTPSEVIAQYLDLIGKPNLPPYWSLGFQISQYGWKNLDTVKTVLDRTVKAGIPLDVIYGDIDYMDRYLDFTWDKVNYATLPEFIQSLQSRGMKYVPILDPGIDTDEKDYEPFQQGMALDVFIKHENGTLFKGKVWNPGHTAFPDFTHPKAYEFWSTHVKQLHSELKFNGLWIDMNEPANTFQEPVECPATKWDSPPFVPKIHDPKHEGLKFKTVCMSAKQHLGIHYNLHNLYGIAQSEITYRTLKDLLHTRPFILSRSTFPGSGHYANHWTGDVFSDWSSLGQSVTDMMLNNMFGIPMVGADICGFIFNTTNELCARWSSLGAFYPFSRNHNALESMAQDPASPNFGPEVKESTKKALTLRYSLLPYLYTLLFKASLHGHTVVRPLFFEFPNDKLTYALDQQFLWGSALLFVPVLKEGVTSVEAYLPQGTWYTYPQLDKEFISPENGLRETLTAPLTDIPVLIRGGSTIVTQTPDVTTTKSRLNDFQIVVVLNSKSESTGDLFWDDGDTLDQEDYNFIELSTKTQCLQSKVVRYNHEVAMKIDSVKIVGVKRKVTTVTIAVLETKENLKFTQDETIGVLQVDVKSSGITFETNFNICWK